MHVLAKDLKNKKTVTDCYNIKNVNGEKENVKITIKLKIINNNKHLNNILNLNQCIVNSFRMIYNNVVKLMDVLILNRNAFNSQDVVYLILIHVNNHQLNAMYTINNVSNTHIVNI